MPKTFISYRRNDSAEVTKRLHDRLEIQFGPQSVFMDIDSIPPGVDFRKRLSDAVQQTDVLLAVIGDGWLGEQYEQYDEQYGDRRIFKGQVSRGSVRRYMRLSRMALELS